MKKYINLLLLIIWMSIIYYFSSQNGESSSALSNGILYKICLLLNVEDFETFILNYEFLIRKFAHFIEYFILGTLMYMTLDEFSFRKVLLTSLLLCVLYAASDEFHQYFVSSRSASLLDVLLDSFGAFAGIISFHLINLRCYQEKKR